MRTEMAKFTLETAGEGAYSGSKMNKALSQGNSYMWKYVYLPISGAGGT